MWKKVIFTLFLIIGLSALVYASYQIYKFSSEIKEIVNPTATSTKHKKEEDISRGPIKIPQGKVFNILLLGIDRRHKSETAFRTDIMILVSVNTDKKKVVLTSVPRDLWVNGGRVNAIYVGSGIESMYTAFEKITGQKVHAFIQSDFEDLVWLVDAMGGLDIELDNAFTDSEYPNDITKGYITISYPAGKQHIDGINALRLSRSRHGNNGEGSDFKRMIRQHKILIAMQDAVTSSTSSFNPFNIKTFYEAVTAPEHMVTDLTLQDAKFLWDFYPHRSEYVIEDFYVDSEFLYNPPLSEYGGAWVVIPKNNDYTPIHMAINERLGLIEPKQETKQEESQTNK